MKYKNFEMITKAIRLIDAGAKFLATNPDASGPTEHGIEPACGAMAALIEKASGKSQFFIGKSNPLIAFCWHRKLQIKAYRVNRVRYLVIGGYAMIQ
jgi:ribonucleotide monophosphatase NagD (HAD superfamily)